jgi:hypothetical protein
MISTNILLSALLAWFCCEGLTLTVVRIVFQRPIKDLSRSEQQVLGMILSHFIIAGGFLLFYAFNLPDSPP